MGEIKFNMALSLRKLWGMISLVQKKDFFTLEIQEKSRES